MKTTVTITKVTCDFCKKEGPCSEGVEIGTRTSSPYLQRSSDFDICAKCMSKLKLHLEGLIPLFVHTKENSCESA